jgi:non-heme chloroperoxidase
VKKQTKQLIGLGLAGAAAGSAAFGLYRSTHPEEAKGAPTPGTRPRRSLTDDLFDMPDSVTHGDIDTPDGGTIHYAEKGSGRPLVLLHGVTLRHDVWAPQFNMLADTYRVIAVDLRGHGRSEVGSLGLGLPRLATDVATLLESLDLRDVILVGHSMGGMTVMRFCGDHPDVLRERVAGIALVATAAYGTVPPLLGGAFRRLLDRGAAQVAAGRSLPAQALLTRWAVRTVFGDHPSPRAIDIVTEMTRSIDDASLIGSLQGIVEHDARDALRATRTPSLVVVGTRDTLTPVPLSRKMARLMPGCEFVVLPRAGHQLMQERPNELADLIDAFVARIEGEADSVAEAVDTEGSAVSPDQVEAPAEAV